MIKNLLRSFLITGIVLTASAFAQPELDTTFNSTGIKADSFGFSAIGDDLAIQADNKIVMVGACQQGAYYQCVARYNENGSLDTTFGNQGFFLNVSFTRATGIAVQNDGKIVTVGYLDQPVTNTRLLGMARYNPDGSLDLSFGSGGKVLVNFGAYQLTEGTNVAIQPDGKIVAVGLSSTYSPPPGNFPSPPPPATLRQGWVARYSANGTLDNSFAAGGIFRLDMSDLTTAESLIVQTDGKIMIGGSLGAVSGPLPPVMGTALLRLNSNGFLDTTFSEDGIAGPGVGPATGAVRSITSRSNGRFLALVGENVLFSFNGNGTLDTTFDGDGWKQIAPSPGSSSEVVVSSGGRITSVGFTPNGSSVFSVARLRSDGSFDASFNGNGLLTLAPTSLTYSTASTCAVDHKGRVVVGGFSGTSTTYRFALMRFVAPIVPVTIYGRVLDSSGRPVSNVTVKLQEGVSTRTNPFGYYVFSNVMTGQSYTISIKSRGLTFTPQTIFLTDDIEDLDFTGLNLANGISKD